MTTHHPDQFPSQRTVRQPEQEELPPVLAREREPQADQRGRWRKWGRKAIVGVVAFGSVIAGVAGMRALDNDNTHAGPVNPEHSTSASEVPGTQETEKTPEVKLSEFTAETMPFYGPDGKKFEGIDEVQTYLNNIPMAEFPTRHAAAEEFVNRLGYVTAMGITPEAVNFYGEAENDLTGSQYAPQTEVEMRTGAMDELFTNTFVEKPQFMQQNREELVAFAKNTHNAAIATANDMFKGDPESKPFNDWEPFTITHSERSGAEDEGGESRIIVEHTFVAPGREGKYVFAMDMRPRDAQNWGISAFNLQKMPETWSPN